ncbi:hypothetical protein C8R46DRAFT_1212724 [Mycena filopes]|nr:hypothetical protein C8R46DRAFT_1212724 [Mycena filopes]
MSVDLSVSAENESANGRCRADGGNPRASTFSFLLGVDELVTGNLQAHSASAFHETARETPRADSALAVDDAASEKRHPRAEFAARDYDAASGTSTWTWIRKCPWEQDDGTEEQSEESESESAANGASVIATENDGESDEENNSDDYGFDAYPHELCEENGNGISNAESGNDQE